VRGGLLLALLVPGLLWAGPVEVFREGPQFCPRDRPKTAPKLTEAQAIERARALLPRDFCGPNWYVDGCDAMTDPDPDHWLVYVQQFKKRGTRHDWAGRDHSYVILDQVGNCLANIPGTELGSRN
jgi:hypothetical protein